MILANVLNCKYLKICLHYTVKNLNYRKKSDHWKQQVQFIQPLFL